MYIPYMDGMGCIYAQVPTNKSHTQISVLCVERSTFPILALQEWIWFDIFIIFILKSWVQYPSQQLDFSCISAFGLLGDTSFVSRALPRICSGWKHLSCPRCLERDATMQWHGCTMKRLWSLHINSHGSPSTNNYSGICSPLNCLVETPFNRFEVGP